MPDILTPLLTRVAMALIEAIAVRLLWRLWASCARSRADAPA